THPAPNVINPSSAVTRDLLFYDGTCGLCHRSVLFAMNRDREGTLFRFAPIGGQTWREQIEGKIPDLPDSLGLRTAAGRTLVRSEAVLRIGELVGGPWQRVTRLAGLLPHWLLDLCYDGVARIRRKLFAPPPGVCPIVPAELRGWFLA